MNNAAAVLLLVVFYFAFIRKAPPPPPPKQCASQIEPGVYTIDGNLGFNNIKASGTCTIAQDSNSYIATLHDDVMFDNISVPKGTSVSFTYDNSVNKCSVTPTSYTYNNTTTSISADVAKNFGYATYYGAGSGRPGYLLVQSSVTGFNGKITLTCTSPPPATLKAPVTSSHQTGADNFMFQTTTKRRRR